MNSAREKSLARIRTIVAQFSPHWSAWTSSPYCVLSIEEIEIIESYLEHETHEPQALELSKNVRQIRYICQSAVDALTTDETRDSFQKWLAFRKLLEHDLVLFNADLSSDADAQGAVFIKASTLIKIFRALQGKEAISFTNEELEEISWGENFGNEEVQSFYNSCVCIKMYVTADE